MHWEHFTETDVPPSPVSTPVDMPFASAHTEVIPITPASESALDIKPAAYDLTITPRETPIEQPHPTAQEIQDALFNNYGQRPDAKTMASLVEAGVTEMDIVRTLPHEAPDMMLLYHDLETLIPSLQGVSHTVAHEYAGQLILHASRDADSLHDTHTILHPEQPTELIPASVSLLTSPSLLEDPVMAQSFLSQYRLTEDAVHDPEFKAMIIDSCFDGSVLDFLDRVIQNAYGISLVEKGQLDIRVVGASGYAVALGRDIPFDPDWDMFGPEQLPRTHIWTNRHSPYRPDHGYSAGVKLGIAMQLMPRFHGPYTQAVMHNGQAVAMPEFVRPTYAINTPECNDPLIVNANLVNRVAAAVVQHSVVSRALQARSGCKDPQGGTAGR